VYRGILPDHHADTPPLPFPAHPLRAFPLLARGIAEINDVPRKTEPIHSRAKLAASMFSSRFIQTVPRFWTRALGMIVLSRSIEFRFDAEIVST